MTSYCIQKPLCGQIKIVLPLRIMRFKGQEYNWNLGCDKGLRLKSSVLLWR